MRIGCCVNMVTKSPDVSGIDLLPDMVRLGFDYAELSLAHLCRLSDGDFYARKSEMIATGMQLEACNNFFPSDIRLTGEDTDKNRITTYLDRAIRRAEELGVQLIVFGSGPARMVPEGYSREKATDQLTDLLKLIGNYARSSGITIAIEPLRKQECNIINTYREALRLADFVNEKNIKCVLDFFHLFEEKEDLAVILEDKDKLVHVHFSDPAGRSFPKKANQAVYKDYFSNLHCAGYNNRISIEAFSVDFNKDAENALNMLREIAINQS